MQKVGVRELKTNLSRYLEQVKRGERVIVTERGKEVAELAPLSEEMRAILHLSEKGVLHWDGKKPRPFHEIKVEERMVSDIILEQRE